MMRQSKRESKLDISSVLQYTESDLRKIYIQMERIQDPFFMKNTKRFRSAFTTEQINILESEYRKFPYIRGVNRTELSRTLNIPERAIKIWFQNRRMKEKKEASISDPEYDYQYIHNINATYQQHNNVAAISSAYYQHTEPLLLLAHNEVCNNSDEKAATRDSEPVAESSKTMSFKELEPKHETSSSLNRDFGISLPVLNNISPSYKASAEFSIDLCKKYRNDIIYKNNLERQNKFEKPSIPLTKQKNPEDNKCVQNVPVDLSFNKTKCTSLESLPNTLIPGIVGLQPAYVANHAQPYPHAANKMEKSRDLYFMNKTKKYRLAFTTEQIFVLESEYRKFPYLGVVHRRHLAKILNIPEGAIKVWFQNRRVKGQKETAISEPECDYQNISIMNAMASVYHQHREPLPLPPSHKEVGNNSDEKATCGSEPVAESSKTSSLNRNNNTPSNKASAKFSMDFCKKYRNDLIYKNRLRKEIKFENASMPLIKQENPEDNKCEENVAVDLSFNKPKCTSLEILPNTLIPVNVALQPVYVANNAQPYLSAANMVWNPVNVLPTMSTASSTVTVTTHPTENFSASQEQREKKCTKCGCDPSVTTTEPENPLNTHPQLIITAEPFENYSIAPPKP